MTFAPFWRAPVIHCVKNTVIDFSLVLIMLIATNCLHTDVISLVRSMSAELSL